MNRRTTSTWITIAIILLAAGWSGCDRNSSRMLPRELQGVWTSDDPRYHDRLLELSPTFVILVTGRNDSPSVQWIDRVKSEPSGPSTTLTVYSTDRSIGQHFEMTLLFSPANGGEIRFHNQREVWKRHIEPSPTVVGKVGHATVPPSPGVKARPLNP